MLADLLRILKIGGKLIVYEYVARKEGVMDKPCKRTIYIKGQLTDAFIKAAFTLGPNFKNSQYEIKGSCLYYYETRRYFI